MGRQRSGLSRTRPARRWVVVGTALALLLGAIVAVVQLMRPQTDAQIVSIKTNATYQDPERLARAWRLPVAELYRRSGWEYQRNASFCGPTSLANVARSLGQAATQESMADDVAVTTILGYLPLGLTLDDLARIARRKLKRVEVRVARDLDLDAFRAEIARANDPNRRIVVNFTRAPLFGAGHGHHSPVLGYLAVEDLVFVGDVNADFKPWLVPAARLFQAVDTRDATAGKARGMLIVETAARRKKSR